MKKKITVNIDEAVLNKVKDLVYWTPSLTLNGLIEMLLIRTIDEMGEANPRPNENLKTGRNVK
jgi:hypothetical protein